MSDGGLSFDRVGKELGDGRWKKGLSVEPRGLSLENNILLLFQRTCAFYVLFFILSSWQGENVQRGCMLMERMQFQG
jgi:hypothetical protein